MRARKVATLLLLGALAAPARAAEPAPADLLAMAFSPAPAPYSGRVTLTRWEGSVRRSEEANVYFRPPQSYRYEFLAPNGSVDRVVLSDGARREVQFVTTGQVSAVDRADAPPAMTDAQRRRLLANYKVTATGRERVMARDAWVLDIAPVLPGKPRERILIDRESHVVLETRLATDEAGSSTQFTRFEPNATLPDRLFAWKGSVAAQKEAATDVPVKTAAWPETLPGGFGLVSADTFLVNGQNVRQFVYSDGLSRLSLFVTASPVKAPDADARDAAALDLRLPDTVRQWRSQGSYVTAVGTLPAPLLAEIQQKIN